MVHPRIPQEICFNRILGDLHLHAKEFCTITKQLLTQQEIAKSNCSKTSYFVGLYVVDSFGVSYWSFIQNKQSQNKVFFWGWRMSASFIWNLFPSSITYNCPILVLITVRLSEVLSLLPSSSQQILLEFLFFQNNNAWLFLIVGNVLIMTIGKNVCNLIFLPKPSWQCVRLSWFFWIERL